MAQILDGKTLNKKIAQRLREAIAEAPKAPRLAIVQVADRDDSASYIRMKKKFADDIGAEILHVKLPENVTMFELVEKISDLNDDTSVNGIILQLPLPKHLNANDAVNAIKVSKDVDGLTAVNMQKLLAGHTDGMLPATAKGIVSLLKENNISIAGKKVLVIGRSYLVGKPIALLMLGENATVTVVHSKSGDYSQVAKESDIIISAAGKPELITNQFTNPNQVIVDVGLTMITGADGEKHPVGDVDFANVSKVVKAISPVPGGVGPMTVATLFENLVKTSII